MIEEMNEFTWDMVRALPKVYHHYSTGNPCDVRCKKGLASLYRPFCRDVTECKGFSENNDPETYENARPSWTKKEWLPPPLKELWRGRLSFDKPVMVIQNKYSLEWGRQAYNYFTLEVLEDLFETFSDSHTIIYIRPKGRERNFYKDQNAILKFQDYRLIRQKYRKRVLTMGAFWWKLRGLDFNQRQFAIHACADKHLAVSGGNACIAAYFGGDLLIFDSKDSHVSGRGVWKTDSWLKELSGSKVYGFDTLDELVRKAKELWM